MSFFSLGRTVVHLLTNKSPLDFYDPHTGKLNWHDAAPDISPSFKKYLDKLMQPLPKDRPKNTIVILQRFKKIDNKLYPSKKSQYGVLCY